MTQTKVKPMHGYVINPAEQKVTEAIYFNWKSIYPLIRCSVFDVVHIARGVDVFVDDEGLLKNPEWFFAVKGYPAPLAGMGLMMGVDAEGETRTCPLTLAEARERVIFLRRDPIIRSLDRYENGKPVQAMTQQAIERFTKTGRL